MADSKFSVDGPALEGSTRPVMLPDHVMPLHEEEEIMEAVVEKQVFQSFPGTPAPQEEQGEQATDAPEDSLLKCILEDAGDRHRLHAFQEYELYTNCVNSGSDCSVPEDELTDEMEDLSDEEDQLVPESLVEEEGPNEGDHDQPSPVVIPVEDIKGNETSPVNLHVTVVNVQVTEPEDPSTPRLLDFNIATSDTVYPEADQEVIPGNQLDVEVHSLRTTSAAAGESSSSSRILVDIHVDPKPPAAEDSFKLLHEAVNGDSIEQVLLEPVIEAGAPES